MEERVTQLENTIQELQRRLDQLNSNSTIPKNVGDAFIERTKTKVIVLSSKSASSENQAVDENGMGTYNVLKTPDGFASTDISGTTYYFPYFT